MAETTIHPANSRIPSLDGIRAVAISLVIIGHSLGRMIGRHPAVKPWAFATPDGVGIFFVLSGFLITWLLLAEYDRTGTISFRRFYIRRCFRILPPAYAYLLFILILFLAYHLTIHWVSYLSAVFFYRDYAPGISFWATEHYWSLGVEEQFYLLWPAVLLWGLHSGGRRRAAKIAAIGIFLAPVFRVGGKLAHIAFFHHKVGMMFQDRIDALMAGALFALLAGSPAFERWFARVGKYWWFFLAYTFVISRALNATIGVDFPFTVGLTLNSISIAIWLLWLSRHPESLLGRFLNTRLLITMGVLSYSAYLWQTFFIHQGNPTFTSQMPWALLWIWVAAWLSHQIIEKPALKLRNAILRRKTSRDRKLATA